MAYTKTGPFNNNGTPGIQKSFLDAVETSLANMFIIGNVSRISVFSGTASNAGTLQAHGLGVKPDFCVFQETGTAGDTNTFSWDVAASDATNVKVWSLNATARPYIAVAIKQVG